MVRLRSLKSGAVVSVADEKVERMGSEWVSADEPKKVPAKKTASSSKSEK